MSRLLGSLRSRAGSVGLLKLAALVLAGGLGLVGLTRLPGGLPATAPVLPPPPPSDTTFFYGPAIDSASPSGRIHLDTIPIAVATGTQYWIELINGAPDGTHRVDSAKVRWNGRQFVGASDFTSLIESQEKVLAAVQKDTLRVQLWGPTTAYATVRVYGVPEPTFTVYGDTTFTKSNGSTQTWTKTFTTPGDAEKRFFLYLVNGDSLGANRVSTARVKVNGVIRLSNTSITSAVGSAVALFDTLPAGGGEVEVQLTGASGTFVRVRIAASDSLAPTLAVTAPAESAWTTLTNLPVTGTLSDRTALAVTVNGGAATVTANTSFADTVALATDGLHTLTVVATDAADNQSTVTRKVRRDTQAPSLSVTAPASGTSYTQAASTTVTGTVSDAGKLAGVTVNSVAAVVAAGAFGESRSLVYGSTTITTVATDSAGNVATDVRTVVRDTLQPALAITSPADGSSTTADSVTVTGTASDANPFTLTVNGTATTVSGGSYSRTVALALGSNTLTVVATDGAGNTQTVTRSVTRTSPLPPEPSTVASAINQSVQTTVYNSTAFLYTGSSPIQTGVSAGTIRLDRAAVVRGTVLDEDGDPLGGVVVTVAGHSEYGQTLTRATGGYDLAVNGGGELTLNYAKAGYLPAQRQVEPGWNQWTALDSVALVPVAARTATVVLNAGALQVAKSDSMVDSAGARQAVLVVPAGTTMTAQLANGSTVALSDSVKLRVTEYTVGPLGPARMPAALPAASAYTYAAEVTIDEAEALGATGVTFNQPVAFYLDNFLAIPPGYDIPFGSYDRVKAKWVPEADGRVIKIRSVTGGMADLVLGTDTTQSASQGQLDSLGITNAERTALASTYAVGKTLWRTRHSHFSPGDWNLLFWLADQARAMLAPRDNINRQVPNQATTCGSIIGCENQTLGEAIGITGSSMGLYYGSHRVPGYTAESMLDLQVVDDTVPAIPYISGARLRLTIAGQKIARAYPLVAGLRDTVSWDGKDAYGRAVQGPQPALLERCYVYNPPILTVIGGGGGGGGSFGGPARGQGTFLLRPFSTPEICIRQMIMLGAWYVPGQGLGGWTLSAAHAYDAATQTLHLGTGERRAAAALGNVVRNVAGTGTAGRTGDGGQATAATVNLPRDVVVAPNGVLYVSQGGQPSIRRIDSTGVITTFAGKDTLCASGRAVACGDGGPASADSVKFRAPAGLALGPDGTLYIADDNDFRIRKISPAGVISTVIGTGTSGSSGDFGPATSAQIGEVRDIALGPDGSLYLADRGNGRVRRVTPAGIVMPFAGGGSQVQDGVRADQLQLIEPSALAVGPDGSVYIADVGHYRVWKVTPNGIAASVAGSGTACNAAFYDLCGDNGKATQAKFTEISNLSLAADGSLYVADLGNFHIRRVDPRGIITLVIGTGEQACITGSVTSSCRANDGDGSVALRAALHGGARLGMAVAPDGTLYIADGNEVRRISPALPGIVPTDMLIASEDAAVAYLFDNTGRHRATLDALTRDTLLRLSYDTAGRLDSLIDTDANITRVQRDALGRPTAIIAPFGQVTVLTTDTAGYLATVANPGGETVRLWAKPSGLLDSLADPRGKVHKYQYDALGRLRRDDDPAGGYKTLAIASKSDSTEVVQIATALGRTTSYATTTRPNGDVYRVLSDPASLQTRSTITQGGGTTTVLPDSTTVAAQQAGDPRFGMQAPTLVSLVTRLPSGLADTILARRRDSLSNSADPLSLVTQLDSVYQGGFWSTSSYTTATRRLVATSAEGRQSFSRLDPQGRVVSAQVAGIDSVRYVYDTRGRLDSVIDGGRKTKYTYSGTSGRLASVTDPLGRSTQFSYDSAGRVKTQTLPDGRVIAFSYDSAGNLTSLTPPGRPAHGFQYSSAGLTTQYDPPGIPGAKPTRYFYNLDRQVDSIVRPDSLTIGFGYDGAGRPSTVSFDRGTLAFGYSPTNGSLTSIASPGGDSLKFTYDGALPKTVTWKGTLNGSVGVSYNTHFRVTAQTVNGANSVSFAYDKDGLLKQAGALGLRRNTTNGLLLADSLNAVKTTYGYTSRGELAAMHTARGGTALLGTGYVRDSLGRIVQLFDTTLGTAKRWSYVYDLAGRLTADSLNGNLFHAFTYDSNGNRLSYLSGAGTVTYRYDAQDRLLASYANGDSTTYTYGSNGELKTKTVPGGATTTYTYDALGNLMRVLVPNGSAVDTIGYVIDGQNRRVGRTLNGTVTHRWLYQNQLNPVAELDGAGNVVSRFVYGTRSNVPDYLLKGGSVYRLVADHLGSARLVVDTATGAVVQQMDYDEWGVVIASSGTGLQPFGFAGGLDELATGLVRFGQRDFAPTLGRWTIRDQLGLGGGSLGVYHYAGGDPIDLVDPVGLTPARPHNLGLDWTARVDPFEYRGSSGYEIHVYNAVGEEFGVYGPAGWLNKHAGLPTTEIPPQVLNKLNGLNVSELRARGLLAPKGTEDIRGMKYQAKFRAGGRLLGVAGFLLDVKTALHASQAAECNGTNVLDELGEAMVPGYKEFYYGPAPTIN